MTSSLINLRIMSEQHLTQMLNSASLKQGAPASTRFSSYLNNYSCSGSFAGCSSPKTVTVTESLVQFMDHYPSLPLLPNWLISSRSNAKYYSLQLWLPEYKPPAIPLPWTPSLLVYPLSDISTWVSNWHHIQYWTPYLPSKAHPTTGYPFLLIADSASQLLDWPLSHPKLIHQEIILAPPSKSDSLSYFLCYLIGPNLCHLCLNYCNSLTCGFTASTFVIYNLFSIQEPDKLLNENQAQSHPWLPISRGVKAQILQSGSRNSDSTLTTLPTPCSLCSSPSRPFSVPCIHEKYSFRIFLKSFLQPTFSRCLFISFKFLFHGCLPEKANSDHHI